MKKLSIALLTMLLCLTAAVAFSQETPVKPQLFSAYPDRINVDSLILKKIFNAIPGDYIEVPFGSDLVFTGIVESNDVKYSNLQTIIVRSEKFSNSLLALSRITNPDNTITFSGKILNTKAVDGYSINRSETGNYALNKFETGRILQDCRY